MLSFLLKLTTGRNLGGKLIKISKPIDVYSGFKSRAQFSDSLKLKEQ